MKVGPEYSNAVVFLSQVNDDGNQIPRATAFLVGVCDTASGRCGEPLPKQPEFVYLVTARHVIEKARATGKPLHIRGSDADGGLVIHELDSYDAWRVSATTDVAILPMPDVADLAGTCIPLDQFADPGYIEENAVGPGDDVFFVGLFTEHAGSQSNEAIVRFGNISLMPSEPVRLQNADGSAFSGRAYLVEARSWGGQSGSPAFVWLSPLRDPGVITMPSLPGPPGTGPLPLAVLPRLLGLVCGHFDIRQDVAFKGDYSDLKASVQGNAGVALVIPASDIEAELQAIRQ
jgi:hypothetical protein